MEALAEGEGKPLEAPVPTGAVLLDEKIGMPLLGPAVGVGTSPLGSPLLPDIAGVVALAEGVGKPLVAPVPTSSVELADVVVENCPWLPVRVVAFAEGVGIAPLEGPVPDGSVMFGVACSVVGYSPVRRPWLLDNGEVVLAGAVPAGAVLLGPR